MIRIGIIGYGYWGPNLARNVAEADDAKLAAIGDLSPEALARAAKRHPGAKTTTDIHDLLQDPTVDAVAIATPVHTHYALALAALQAGKHVLVEKPMTRNRDEAGRLIEEADRRNLVLMVDHTFVYTPAVRKVRELMTKGELGVIRYYDSIRVNLGLFQRDVNVVWDLAVHDLSILEYIMPDRPAALSANGASLVPGAPESMAHITLFFESGAIAHVNVNWLAPVKVRQTLIGGSQKMIVYDDLEPSEKIKVYDKGVTLTNSTEQIYQMLINYRIGDMWAPQLSATEALRTEVDHFVACVQGKCTPTTDGGMGLRVVEMLEAIGWSMKQRGRPVDFGLTRRAS